MADVSLSVQLQGVDSVNRGLDSVSAKTKKLGDDAAASSAKAKELGSSLGGIGSVFAGLQLDRLFWQAKAAIDATITGLEQIGRQSQALGVTVGDLQRWHLAAERMGVSAGAVDDSLKFLNRTLGDMRSNQVTPAVKMLDLLGVSMKNVHTAGISTGDAFRLLITNLARIPDAATRTSVGMAIFGRGFEEMLQAINDPQKFQAIVDHFKEMGVGISAAAAKYMADPNSKIKDAYVRIQDVFDKMVAGAVMGFDDIGAAAVRTAKLIQDQNWDPLTAPGGIGGARRTASTPLDQRNIGPGTGIQVPAPAIHIHIPSPAEIAAEQKYVQTIAELDARFRSLNGSVAENTFRSTLNQALVRTGIKLESDRGREIEERAVNVARAAREQQMDNNESQRQIELDQKRSQMIIEARSPAEQYAASIEDIHAAFKGLSDDSPEVLKVLDMYKKKFEEVDQVANGIGNAFGSNLERAILSGNWRGIGKSIGKDIEQTLVHELIAAPIAKAISGALHPADGSGLFSGIAKTLQESLQGWLEGLGKWLGGDSPFLSGLQKVLQSAWNALPGILDDAWSMLKSILGGIGGGGLGGIGSLIGDALSFLGFAGGGDLTVTRPQLVMVGERGPERLSVRPLAGGGREGAGGNQIHIHLPQTSVISNLTAGTFARQIARAVNRENRRRV